MSLSLTCIFVLVKDMVHTTEGIMFGQRRVSSQCPEREREREREPIYTALNSFTMNVGAQEIQEEQKFKRSLLCSQTNYLREPKCNNSKHIALEKLNNTCNMLTPCSTC